MKDLHTLLNEIFRQTGRPTVSETSLDQKTMTPDQQMVLDMLNDKQDQIAKDYNWKALQAYAEFTTQAGQDTYTLTGQEVNDNETRQVAPNRITYMENTDANEDEIQILTDREWHRHDRDNAGRPDYYRLYDIDDQGRPVIQLLPEPDGSHTIAYDYYEKPDPLENSADTSPLDDRVLKWGTTEAVLEFDGVEFQRARAEFQQALNDARANNRSGQDIQMGADAKRTRKPRVVDRVDLPL